MSSYARPTLPRQVFYDGAGSVIDYGNRWRGASPPEDSYSVTSNPQRFAPLHLVADALIEHLAKNYLVEVSEDLALAAERLRERVGVSRVVRLAPLGADEAPLTFVFTSYPGVVVYAGLLHDFPFPQCGCDACDESLEGVCDEMEWTVLSVVTGGFSEWIDQRAMLSVGHRISSRDGTRRRSGASARGDLSTERVKTAEQRLRGLPNGWQPWTPRSSTGSSEV